MALITEPRIITPSTSSFKELLDICLGDPEIILKQTQPYKTITQSGIEAANEFISESTPKAAGQLVLERYMLRGALYGMNDNDKLVTSEGSWIKRFRKYLRKCEEIDKAELKTEWYKEFESQLGSLIGAHAVNVELLYRLELEINWDDGEFGDEGSCYWGDRSAARYGITQSEYDGAVCMYKWSTKYTPGYVGIGRCWWHAYHGRWDRILLWNRYGPYRLPGISSSLASMLGWPEPKEQYLRSDDDDGEYLYYINGDCYGLFNEERRAQATFTLSIPYPDNYIPENSCGECGSTCRRDEMYEVGDVLVCEGCFESVSTCDYCEAYEWDDNMQHYTWDDREYRFCSSHCSTRFVDRNTDVCPHCDETIVLTYTYSHGDGTSMAEHILNCPAYSEEEEEDDA